MTARVTVHEGPVIRIFIISHKGYGGLRICRSTLSRLFFMKNEGGEKAE